MVAYHGGLGQLGIYSDWRSALQAFTSVAPRHRAIAEVKGMIKRSKVLVLMYWILVYMKHTFKEHAVGDTLYIFLIAFIQEGFFF